MTSLWTATRVVERRPPSLLIFLTKKDVERLHFGSESAISSAISPQMRIDTVKSPLDTGWTLA